MRSFVSVLTSCYRGERYLSKFFEDVVQQTYFPYLEIVFIHNEPTEKELKIIGEFNIEHPHKIKYISVTPLETLGASWNRGWEIAGGKYITIWNVDDRRTPKSIEILAKTLNNNPNCVMAYGDYLSVPEYGGKEGERKVTPAFSKGYFSRSFPQGGTFYMWERGLWEKVGPFDEQLKVVNDFDFSLRITLAGYSMCRTHELLGYFTDIGEGLSTRNHAQKTAVERNFLYLRHGAYDKIRTQYWNQINQFQVDNILVHGKWLPISQFWAGFKRYRNSRKYLWVLFFVRNFLRAILKKTGLLKIVYRLQARHIQRDI